MTPGLSKLGNLVQSVPKRFLSAICFNSYLSNPSVQAGDHTLWVPISRATDPEQDLLALLMNKEEAATADENSCCARGKRWGEGWGDRRKISLFPHLSALLGLCCLVARVVNIIAHFPAFSLSHHSGGWAHFVVVAK